MGLAAVGHATVCHPGSAASHGGGGGVGDGLLVGPNYGLGSDGHCAFPGGLSHGLRRLHLQDLRSACHILT